MANSSAALTKRLAIEYKQIAKDQSTANMYTACPDGGNLWKWAAKIHGPPDSAYAGRDFTVNIEIDETYPIKPPKCAFVTRCPHPNVDQKGRICLDVLQSGEEGKWTPVIGIKGILLSLYSLLESPEPSSPLDGEAGRAFVGGTLKEYVDAMIDAHGKTYRDA